LSRFAPGSVIARLNRPGEARALAVSHDTLAVLQLARRTRVATGGGFDATAGPLVNAWGFGPAREPRIPSSRELRALRERVGFARLQMDAQARTVRKLHRDMYVDLSGIAKGYGVDRAAHALDALGIGHYVVELGGEVRARGLAVDGDAWHVAIEQPQVAPGSVRRVVPLSDRALATSGDYRIFFERAGRRYCHEIDPVSASPVEHALTSVSVVATDCASADAWATGLMVLGPGAGFALAERLGIAAYFIERAPHGALVDRATSAFAALGAV
jgi:thiamine biosynthesis lipoprotein